MTPPKGSEGPRNTLMYRKILQYGSLFGQGSIPTDSHFSPLFPQNDDPVHPVHNIRPKWEKRSDLNPTIKRYK
jgi:hypothetical protein